MGTCVCTCVFHVEHKINALWAFPLRWTFWVLRLFSASMGTSIFTAQKCSLKDSLVFFCFVVFFFSCLSFKEERARLGWWFQSMEWMLLCLPLWPSGYQSDSKLGSWTEEATQFQDGCWHPIQLAKHKFGAVLWKLIYHPFFWLWEQASFLTTLTQFVVLS